MIKIKTKNLILKELSILDVKLKYVNWLNNKNINRFLESRKSKQTIKSCKIYVDKIKKNPNQYLFGIFIKSKNAHIGNIKLEISHPKEKIADIGILIGEKKYHGKGFGTESIKAIVKFAFKEKKMKRIQAGFYETNTASIKSFLNSGFELDGCLKSYYIFKKKRVARILASIIND